MTKKLNTTLFFALGIIIAGCSQILQNQSLKFGSQDSLSQQEFSIVEKTLTLAEAKSKASSPFIRRVSQAGIRDNARVVSEEIATKSNFPTQQQNVEYKIGIGDSLLFLNFFETAAGINSSSDTWEKIVSNQKPYSYKVGIGDKLTILNLIEKPRAPGNRTKAWKRKDLNEPYLVGIGDELTLIQIKEENINQPTLSVNENNGNGSLTNFKPPEKVNTIIETSGRVGSDGSLLLLEVGRLKASGKTINALQSEVRNVLIRNGISPKFQMEITAFNSQKAYISLSSNATGRLSGSGRVLPITDQPLTLREVLSQAGVSKKPGASANITLQRSKSRHSFDLQEIFSTSAPDIILRDQDHIFVEEGLSSIREAQVIVGLDGNIILPDLGKIKVNGKSVKAIQQEIKNLSTVRNLDYWKDFQIKITGFNSKQVYLSVSANSQGTSKVFPLVDQAFTLKQLLLISGISKRPGVKTNIVLQRSESRYSFGLQEIFAASASDIILKDQDHIFVEDSSSIINEAEVIVGQDGDIILPDLGKIKVNGKSISVIEQEVRNLSKRKNLDYFKDIQIKLVGYGSQRALITFSGDGENKFPSKVLPITNIPQRLDEMLAKIGLSTTHNALTKIHLLRDGQTKAFLFEDILFDPSNEIFLRNGDRIHVETLTYKPSKVFIMGSGLSPKIFNISPSIRETLADALFTENGALASTVAKRSDIYLLRGENPVIAYHLDALNPSRLLVAEAMELRPNDILFVAEQPIISFNRTLQTIIPLRILINDIREGSTTTP